MTPRYFNRELSWLKFNARVLQEANDPSVPLIERLRFLGIFSNNLDEFFKVRYATIQRIYRAGKNATKSLGGISAGDLLNEINQTVIKDQTLSFQILNDLENELAKEKIRFRLPIFSTFKETFVLLNQSKMRHLLCL